MRRFFSVAQKEVRQTLHTTFSRRNFFIHSSLSSFTSQIQNSVHNTSSPGIFSNRRRCSTHIKTAGESEQWAEPPPEKMSESDSIAHEASGKEIPVQIISIKQQTEKVRSVVLSVVDRQKHIFRFQPGQWVDFRVDGISQIGGYSIVSTPGDLEIGGFIEIAVRKAQVEPASWIHTKASLGDICHIKVGGELAFSSDLGEHMILIAGGIGITPMMSILRHFNDTCKTSRISLLYSVKNPEDFVFYEHIKRLSNSERMESHLTVTGDIKSEDGDSNILENVERGRISEEMIKSALNDFEDLAEKRFVICGPHDMIKNMENIVKSCGVSENKIHYELW